MKRRQPMKRGGPIRDRAACDCGHHEEEHFLRGCCDRCGCTWYHPNVRAVKARIAAKKRKPAEFRRVYGSKERVAFVQSLPCAACGRVPSENAHSQNGGLSRKADAASILPLCPLHHQAQHDMGVASFEALYGISLAECAARTEAAWNAWRECAA